MKDRRAIVFLVVLLVVMATGAIVIRTSNSTSSADEPNTEATSQASAPTTSTTAPISKQNRDDFESSVRRVTAVENELFSNPNPDRVAEIMDPDCSCYGQTRAALNNLQKKGWHVKGANLVLESTSVISTEGDKVEGVAELSTLSNPAVDKSGKAVEKPPSPSRQPLVYVMKKGQDGVWRIYDRHLPEEVF